MSRKFTGAGARLRRPQSRTGLYAAAVASMTAAAVGLGVLAGTPAGAHSAAPTPVVTRAALDPALVAGRGASVAFAEQEAENAATDGTVIGPDRTAYTLPAEASGRKAVELTPGEHVEFTLPSAANAITVRYSIPDAPGGGGITAPLDVAVNGKKRSTMTLTSQYSWLYNQYPFSDDPGAELLHPDWWITECSCVPAATSPAPVIEKPFRPSHFYDEQRLLLGRTYRAGDTVRLTVPAGSRAAWTVVDLLDSELVGRPHVELLAADVLAFGADPTGRRDAADAIEKAIAFARRTHLTVYIPPGTYRVDRHIVVDDVTITGAGNWYTKIKGREVTLDEPAADGSVHTGVGFYGKDAADGGSRNVHLSGFAIEGDVRTRIDTDQVNGIGGAMSDSTIEGLHIRHTKVGMWFDGPMKNLRVRGNIIVDQIADAINFHTGVTDSRITHTFVRNSGDDGLAMWSERTANARNTIDHNTVQSPVLANGIAVYGGTDNTVSNNLVADPVREGSALHIGSRFGAEPFTGKLNLDDNTTVRAGTYELNWKIGLGALWIFALDRSIDTADIRVTGDHYLDSTYNAVMLVSDWAVKDRYDIEGVHFKDIRVDGTGTSVLSARAAGGASFENVDARNVGAVGVNNCGSFNFPATGSEFSLTDLGGNDGDWLAPWLLPNTVTCDDRPPVVPPPAPGAAQAAYRTVDIELPRVANDQYNAGPHPSRDELL
ncbi:glycosyl hydrolase family 28-related protein, partial [Streptomyces sp. NPDC005406]|uniref:glycosyl hydrolase family 28-related protein n=1 Tax=Streptomyces sp. NPDC005406 TaxID=3155339 RepID=UPI0034538F1A